MAEKPVKKASSDLQDVKASQAPEPWKVKLFVLGGVVGAAAGLLSAYLLVKNSERTGIQPTVSGREGFQIAVLLLGVIRSIARLWED